MQTTIRAAIMLAVFVGLPAAWIYYGPLPEGAQRVVDRLVTAAREAAGGFSAAGDQTSAETVRGVPRFASASPVGLTPAAGPRSLEEEVEPLLARLRQLGVAHYALEPWGADGRLFRFHCEASLTPNGQITEQFEAVATDPRASIAQVADEVGAWYATRRGGG